MRRNIALILLMAVHALLFSKDDSGVKLQYQVVHGWPILPENTMLDEVSAVAVDSKDEVFVLTRAGRKWPDSDVLDTTAISSPTVFVFDGRTGELLQKWGDNVFALPHSITIDAKDRVWVADVALHQVFQFTHEGKLLLTIGQRGVEGSDEAHFNRPTDVAVEADGSFYVSDGYRNSRIVRFRADGKFLQEWGKKGKDPGEFNLPHGISLDNSGRVYVMDRENHRIQIFDRDGKFISVWNGPPFVNPQDLKVDSDGTVYVVDAGDDKLPDRSGVLILNQDGFLLQRVGRYGNYDGQFVDPHWVAVSHNGDIYVADFTGKRVQKFAAARRVQ